MNLIIIPLVTGITQAFKKSGVSKKYIPLIALVLGVTLSYIGGVTDPIINGLVYGLSGVGLYSASKNTIK